MEWSMPSAMNQPTWGVIKQRIIAVFTLYAVACSLICLQPTRTAISEHILTFTI
jgi:hypothetical protein